MDRGAWKAGFHNNRPAVYSDDFTHDVVLGIHGDFEDAAQGQAYAEWLAKTLNDSSPENREPEKCVGCGHVGGWHTHPANGCGFGPKTEPLSTGGVSDDAPTK